MSGLKKILKRAANGVTVAIGQQSMKSGKPIGKWSYFTDQGRPFESGEYDDQGRRISLWRHFNWKNGLVYDILYRLDKPVSSKVAGKVTQVIEVEEPLQQLNDLLDDSVSSLAG